MKARRENQGDSCKTAFSAPEQMNGKRALNLTNYAQTIMLGGSHQMRPGLTRENVIHTFFSN
jgi:hypothetical protein